MKRKLGAVIFTTSIALAAFATPAAAVGRNDRATSCGVGNVVSANADASRLFFDLGYGQWYKNFGLNPGEVIQDDHEDFVPGCP